MAKISGYVVFNDTLTAPTKDAFTTVNWTCDSKQISIVLLYANGTVGYKMDGTIIEVYNAGWVNEKYKTVYIPDGDYDETSDLYKYLIANSNVNNVPEEDDDTPREHILVEMSSARGVTLATAGKYCAENVKVTPVNAENIIPENIAKGVSIMDVVGTLESGGSGGGGNEEWINDGKFHLYINVTTEGQEMQICYQPQGTYGSAVTIDWGDGTPIKSIAEKVAQQLTHTYEKVGEYIITLECTVDYICLGNKNGTNTNVFGIFYNNSVDHFPYSNACTRVEVGGGRITSYKNAFNSCYKILKAKIPDGVTGIGEYTFNRCFGLSEVELPQSLTYISNYAFGECVSLQEIELPQSLISIHNYAFVNCVNLREIDIPEGVTGIGQDAFKGCKNLKSVKLPSSLTTIGNYVFQLCTKLQEINIPEGITSIGFSAFRYCYMLPEINIPNGITSLQDYVCDSCYSLLRIIIKSDTMCSISSTNAFTYCYHILGTQDNTYNPTGAKDGYIYVRNSLVASYRTATNWSTYASQIMPYVDTYAELSDIDGATYDKAYVGETEKEYTYNGTAWEEYVR